MYLFLENNNLDIEGLKYLSKINLPKVYKLYMSNSFYKPVVGAALVVAGDNLILQNRNMNSSLALGAAAGTAFYLSKNIVKMLPSQSSGNNAIYV